MRLPHLHPFRPHEVQLSRAPEVHALRPTSSVPPELGRDSRALSPPVLAHSGAQTSTDQAERQRNHRPPSDNTKVPGQCADSKLLVRRTKSEGHVKAPAASAGADSVVPRVTTDATLCDRIWTKLDPPSARDSMSSSSSLSSSDTVIDLTLPDLARKTPTTWSGRVHPPLRACSSVHVTKSSPNLQHNSGSSSCVAKSNQNLQQNLHHSCSFVTKSKSNPNLQKTVVPLSSRSLFHISNLQQNLPPSSKSNPSPGQSSNPSAHLNTSSPNISFAQASKSNENLEQNILPSCSPTNVSKSNPNLQQNLPSSCSSAAKSKSNPNLHQTLDQREVYETPRITERRHTWSRLFMEGLRHSGAPPVPFVSKSLGDLTSDDIAPSFDSKYRSIRRSFVIRTPRTRPDHTDDLTAQLRILTDVEPLPPAHTRSVQESLETSVDEGLVRKASSRSQSRVRYINNRAKKNQERQRLQRLSQGSHGSAPIEERGNPEGACSVANSPCSGLDLLALPSDSGSDAARLLKL